MADTAYKYRSSLKGHTSDVRSVYSYSNNSILSCSRDKTTRLWDEENGQYKESSCFLGHKKFVSCVVAMFPVNDIYPDGLIFTGSNDKTIHVYSNGKTDPLLALSGHLDNVCCLSVDQNGLLVSGSWDMTARLWKIDVSSLSIEGSTIYEMVGHKAAVWDVIFKASQEVVITASADKTIKIFKSGKLFKTLTGHEDCVRGLAWLNNQTFISCSNDASIRKWDLGGKCLDQYYGHKNYIYSIAVLPGSTEFVSCSEDRTVKVWSMSKPTALQTISLPAQSPWSIIAMNNGDVAVGCSDAVIHIFTRSPDRFASDEDRAIFQAELSSCKIAESANDLGDIDTKSLPTRDFLQNEGKKDGQVQMIKHEGKVEAYQWSSSDNQWINIGEVVGSEKSSKSTYMGKEYDYVFSVDIQEGRPPLKLPYNMSEDPWEAAQRFIDNENLDQQFLEKIANFIYDNSKATGQSQLQNSSSYRDPFTGSGGYVPMETSSFGQASETDPFTGTGRHIPSGDNGVRSEVSSNIRDPMIAPDRYVPDQESTNPFFPQQTYITFASANSSAMIKKIMELSENSSSNLDSDDLVMLENLTDVNHKPTHAETEQLWKLLHWPSNILFPVIDLLRLFIVHHPNHESLFTNDRIEEIFGILMKPIVTSDESKPSTSARFLSLRCLSNLFTSTKGIQMLIESSSYVLDITSLPPSDRMSKIAASTLLLNYAVLFNLYKNEAKYDEVRMKNLTNVLTHLMECDDSSEACFRLLVTFGTIICNNDVCAAAALSLDAHESLLRIERVHSSSEKVTKCIPFIKRLLK